MHFAHAAVESHIVVVGLGDVGTRVLTALDDLGVAVVGIDRNPQARGVEVARQRRIPIIVGDAGRQETLRSASVQSARSLVVLTGSDLASGGCCWSRSCRWVPGRRWRAGR